jgi:hypothetical protein
MQTVKRFDGDYTLESRAGSATITIGKDSTDAVVLPGDLTVNGTTTTVNSTVVDITDNIITLNNGEVGAGVTLGTAGITIDRGSSDDAHLLYDETNDIWVVDQGIGGNVAILTGPIGGGAALLNIVEDTTPQLGGYLDVNLNPIIATANHDGASTVSGSGDIILTAPNTGNIRLDGPAVISGPAPNVTPAAGDVALYQGTDTGGGTQILFENDTETGELVSKTKALVFGLIL